MLGRIHQFVPPSLAPFFLFLLLASYKRITHVTISTSRALINSLTSPKLQTLRIRDFHLTRALRLPTDLPPSAVKLHLQSSPLPPSQSWSRIAAAASLIPSFRYYTGFPANRSVGTIRVRWFMLRGEVSVCAREVRLDGLF